MLPEIGAAGLPELRNSGLTMSLGALAADYVLRRRAAAYLPARFVQNLLDEGRLHLVPDAPRFPYPVWAVWRADTDAASRAIAEAALDEITTELDAAQDGVLDLLAELSHSAEAAVLGADADAPTHNE